MTSFGNEATTKYKSKNSKAHESQYKIINKIRWVQFIEAN